MNKILVIACFVISLFSARGIESPERLLAD